MLKISRFVNESELLKIKSKLEYVPEFWNLEEVLKKNASDLSLVDIERLAQVKKDKEMAMNLQKILDRVESGVFLTVISEENKMIDYILYYSNIPSVTLNKISEEDIKYVNELISKYDGSNHEEINKLIEEISNLFVRDYASGLLKKAFVSYHFKSRQNDLDRLRAPRRRYRPVVYRRY